MNSADPNKILFLDIETIPQVYKYNELATGAKELWDKKFQYNKEVGPEKQYEKAGIYAEFAKVICIGLGFYNEGKFRVKCLASENEKEVLLQFSDLLAKHFSHFSNVLCAHNGKEFDFPFLCRRFIINKIPLPKILRIQGLKPWEIKHIDTLDLWKFGDVKNFTSLNLLAHVLGVPSPKDDIDGSMVAKTFYEENGLERIRKYCMKDVITLARVYKRFGGEEDLHDDEIIFV
jgi:predicted PolB exonuclease-like 3'-5' exonuclease